MRVAPGLRLLWRPRRLNWAFGACRCSLPARPVQKNIMGQGTTIRQVYLMEVRMRTCTILCVTVGLGFAAVPGLLRSDTGKEPTPERIASLITQLGHDEF